MENKESFVFSIPKQLWRNKRLTLNLAKNDFKARFAGSYLGLFWAFIQPVMTVLVYWFVFEVGFKSSGVTGVPFVLFLVTGIVPWFFFSDALSGANSSMMEYSYLVKKVVFNIDILPFVKIISALFVHLFFVAFAIFLLCLYGFYPKVSFLQLFYYMFCNLVFVTSLSYLFSALTVFFRDLQQITGVIILQIGMWLTPILWSAPDMLGSHPTLMKIFKLNPMYYIVDGFRDSLLWREVTLPSKGLWTLYFWIFTIIVYLLGAFCFKRLKPHFADVL